MGGRDLTQSLFRQYQRCDVLLDEFALAPAEMVAVVAGFVPPGVVGNLPEVPLCLGGKFRHIVKPNHDHRQSRWYEEGP